MNHAKERRKKIIKFINKKFRKRQEKQNNHLLEKFFNKPLIAWVSDLRWKLEGKKLIGITINTLDGYFYW
jgi:hypothetical protein